MAQQTMRGMRLGTQSLESERGVNFSARITHTFQCSNEHLSELIFAADAEIPQTWQCKSCTQQAVQLKDGKQIKLDASELKIPRSHWEMLLERRSREELEEILQERLDYIRARRAGGQADL
jgi:thioesterase domain-containing protein